MLPAPVHAFTHEPAHHTPPRGHMRIGGANADRVALIALRIEGAPGPMPGAGRLDPENKAIAHLLTGDAMSDPCVARANRRAARCDMDLGLPSERAQSPRYACPASEAPLAPIVMSVANAIALRDMRMPPKLSPSRLREQPAPSIRVPVPCCARPAAEPRMVDGHSVPCLTLQINRFISLSTDAARRVRANSRNSNRNR